MKTLGRGEKTHLNLLFFLFGVGIMAVAPRNPEIKHNLGIDNGTFGTLLSLGGAGSVISLLFGGHVVHRLGPRPVLVVASTVMYSCLAVMPHLHTAWLFLVINILAGLALSSYHVSINGQALYRQEGTGLVLIPRLHGLWSLGAVTTAIFAFFITSHVSLAWHIDVMMAVIWLATQFSIWQLRDNFFAGSEERDAPSPLHLKSLIAAFGFERLITFGLLGALMIEFATNDWATIFAREQIGMSPALSILPYILFVLSMISVRFTIHKLLFIKPERFWMRVFPIYGGITFIALELFGTHLAHTHKNLGFAVLLLGFIAGGIGCSHLAPTFFGIAGRKSDLPGSVVVGQLGFVNTILIAFIKIGISWVAQATSVLFALIIPGLMLITVASVSRLGRDKVLTA